MSSEFLLCHYDLSKNLVLVCDASPYGVGAVVLHVHDTGRETPIAFVSRTLHASERNYAQIDREALGIIFGVTKFRQYLYGRKFVIYTDHKSLLRIFHPHRQMQQILSPRMLRWTLTLGAYNYELQ